MGTSIIVGILRGVYAGWRCKGSPDGRQSASIISATVTYQILVEWRDSPYKNWWAAVSPTLTVTHVSHSVLSIRKSRNFVLACTWLAAVSCLLP